MSINQDLTVGEIVAQDYRTASVFQSYGIDFCCKGGRKINEVCESKELKTATLLQELQDATSARNMTADYLNWPLDLLADYIEKKHHRYVARKTPELMQYLNKLCKVHGGRHPELFDIRDEFAQMASELASHMEKEEMVLFPFIRKLANVKKMMTPPPFGTVQNPIHMMMREHSVEGDRLARISEYSNQYTAPADGCTTYRVTFAMLKEFEEDLHFHIHLENNVMFPRAIELEQGFTD